MEQPRRLCHRAAWPRDAEACASPRGSEAKADPLQDEEWIAGTSPAMTPHLRESGARGGGEGDFGGGSGWAARGALALRRERGDARSGRELDEDAAGGAQQGERGGAAFAG